MNFKNMIEKNNKVVILVSGKIGSGKDTVTKILKEKIEKKIGEKVLHEFFARALKEKCKDSFRPLIDFLNKTFEEIRDESIDISHLITKDENFFENKNEITRNLLQIVGSEIVRSVDPDYWVNKTIENIKNSEMWVVIISDCRFPSEIEAIEDNFPTIKIRVSRSLDRSRPFNEHHSEKALDDYKHWDMYIKNNGTLEQLEILIDDLIFRD